MHGISVQCPTFYYVVPRDDMSTSGQHIWMFHLQPCIICIMLSLGWHVITRATCCTRGSQLSVRNGWHTEAATNAYTLLLIVISSALVTSSNRLFHSAHIADIQPSQDRCEWS